MLKNKRRTCIKQAASVVRGGDYTFVAKLLSVLTGACYGKVGRAEKTLDSVGTHLQCECYAVFAGEFGLINVRVCAAGRGKAWCRVLNLDSRVCGAASLKSLKYSDDALIDSSLLYIFGHANHDEPGFAPEMADVEAGLEHSSIPSPLVKAFVDFLDRLEKYA